MAIDIECDSCHATYRVADPMAGKRLRCKQCGKPIMVPAAGGMGAPPAERERDDQDPLAALSHLTESPGGAGSESGVLGGTPVEPEWTSDVNPWDLPASMQEIRGRLGARPTQPFRYPMSDVVDSFLPWVLVGLGIIPAAVTAISRITRRDDQLVGWIQLVLAAALFCGLIIPLTVKALRSAGRSFKFRVPDSAYPRVLAAFSVALGLGAFFYSQLGDDRSGFVFGYGLGAFVGTLLLGVLFHLLPVEIFFTGLFTVGFFLVTSVASFYAVEGARPLVGLLRASTERKPTNVARNTPPKPGATPGGGGAGATPKPAVSIPIAEPQPAGPKPAEPAEPQPVAPAEPPPPPKPVEPEIPPIVFHTTSNAVQEVVVLDRPRDFDAIFYPLTAGPGGTTGHMGTIRRSANDDAVDVWSLNPLPIVRATLPLKRQQGGGTDRYALSPDGATFARLITWPRLAVQLITVEGQRIRTIDLNPNLGQPEVVGFTSPDVLAVRFTNGGLAGVELWDVKNSKLVRQVPLPADLPRGHAISPDGRFVAVAVPPDGRDPRPVASVHVIELAAAAGRSARKLQVTGLDPKLPLTVAGLAFSPDSRRLALLCENNDNLLIETWELGGATLRPANEHIYAAGQLPLNNLSQFPGRCFDWMPDGSAFLLYGNVIVDADPRAGTPRAAFGFDHVRSQQILTGDTIQLEFQHPGEQKALARVVLAKQSAAAAGNGGEAR